VQDSVKDQFYALLAAIGLISLFLALGIVLTTFAGGFSFAGVTEYPAKNILFWVVWLLPISLFVLVAISFGMEVDGIYEKGLSSGQTNLIEHLKGLGFVPFDTITSVRIDRRNTPRGATEIIRVYSGESEKPSGRFVEMWYKNDFWIRLKQILRTRCPNAKWIVGDWLS
jgi:hypothetical protein